MTEYIIMASGEIITEERIEAWADASNEDVSTAKAKMLASGEIAPLLPLLGDGPSVSRA